MYMNIYTCIIILFVILHTRNYALAIASASLPLRSPGEPLGIPTGIKRGSPGDPPGFPGDQW